MARGDAKDLFFRELRTAGLSRPAVEALARRLDALETLVAGSARIGPTATYWANGTVTIDSSTPGAGPKMASAPLSEPSPASDTFSLVDGIYATVPPGVYAVNAQAYIDSFTGDFTGYFILQQPSDMDAQSSQAALGLTPNADWNSGGWNASGVYPLPEGGAFNVLFTAPHDITGSGVLQADIQITRLGDLATA